MKFVNSISLAGDQIKLIKLKTRIFSQLYHATTNKNPLFLLQSLRKKKTFVRGELFSKVDQSNGKYTLLVAALTVYGRVQNSELGRRAQRSLYSKERIQTWSPRASSSSCPNTEDLFCSTTRTTSRDLFCSPA